MFWSMLPPFLQNKNQTILGLKLTQDNAETNIKYKNQTILGLKSTPFSNITPSREIKIRLY